MSVVAVRENKSGTAWCGNTGRPLTHPLDYTERQAAVNATCSVDGCERSVVIRSPAYCDAHYRRWRKTGDAGPGEIRDGKPHLCKVSDCTDAARARGWCPKHWQRWRKHGDPTVIKPPHQSTWNSPTEHPRWKGDAVSYGRAHRRVDAVRGKAREHKCEHCGAPAEHWAYDHEDPNELTDSNGRKYSVKPEHYMPLCVSCHWRFDGAAARLPHGRLP